MCTLSFSLTRCQTLAYPVWGITTPLTRAYETVA